MSYFPQGNLVARKGYSSTGDLHGGQSDLIKKLGGKTPPPPPAAKQSSGGSWWDKLLGAGGKVLDYYGTQQEQQAKQAELDVRAMEAQARMQGGMPSWVLPAVAVGGAAALFLVLKKKK